MPEISIVFLYKFFGGVGIAAGTLLFLGPSKWFLRKDVELKPNEYLVGWRKANGFGKTMYIILLIGLVTPNLLYIINRL